MKKNPRIVMAALAVVLMFSGCGAKNESEGNQLNDKEVTPSTLNYEFIEEEQFAWKDNSLDELQAVFNLPLEAVKAEGEMNGGAVRYFACENGIVRFKNHLNVLPKNSWSGASGIDNHGQVFSEKIEIDSEKFGTQVDELGSVAGSTDYVAYDFEMGEGKEVVEQSFYRLNDRFELIGSVQVKELFDYQVTDIAGDAKGDYHALVRGSHGSYYVIYSPDGEKLFESSVNDGARFRVLDDGSVLVLQDIFENGMLEKYSFAEADVENKVLKEIAELDSQKISDFTGTLAAKSRNEIVWCNSEGIYICNEKGEEARRVYLWANHGISFLGITNIFAKADGTIGLIYQDDGGFNGLWLKPTLEEVEIQRITFATSSWRKDDYVEAVTAFNRMYPSYNIEIKDDYEEVTLRTQLGAGTGPVLVDTSLTGFDGLKKLWQPLNSFLEETGLADELIPQATEFGKIDGETYGIVTAYTIDLLITKDKSFADWNYEGFLDAAEKFDGATFVYEYDYGITDRRSSFFSALSNGLNDNLYFDLEDNSMIFGTPAFERVLKIAEKAKECPLYADGLTLKNGEALCEIYSVSNISSLTALRKRIENGDYAVGYPTKNGAKYLLWAKQPITIRCTATEEEKKIAYSFLKMILSHDIAEKECSGPYGRLLSVRKDILKDQMDYYNAVFKYNKDFNPDLVELDREKDEALFEELLSNAVPLHKFPADLQNVFDEEFDEYLNGEIPADLLDSRLKSRIGLYLDER